MCWSLAATVTEPSYEASLNLGETYYWKVNEVNAVKDPAAWESDVWSFSTQPYIVLDNFENYTNESPKRLFQTWIDGLGFSPDDFFPKGGEGNGSGALVGYDPLAGDIVETVRVNSGSQSMPMFYDNSTASYSEAQRTFAEPQDWTQVRHQDAVPGLPRRSEQHRTDVRQDQQHEGPLQRQDRGHQEDIVAAVEYRSGLDRREPDERHEAGHRGRRRRRRPACCTSTTSACIRKRAS